MSGLVEDVRIVFLRTVGVIPDGLAANTMLTRGSRSVATGNAAATTVISF